jgi:site-specific recombinase XerD
LVALEHGRGRWSRQAHELSYRCCDHAEAKGRKRSTVTDYRSAVRVHFGYFGTRPLDAISGEDVERFMAALQRKGRSVKSIRNWIGLLSAVFNYSRRQRWCAANPCDAVELPRVEASDDIRFLTQEELTALLRATGGNGRLADTDRTMYLAAAMTGMRQGELLAASLAGRRLGREQDQDSPELRTRALRLTEVQALNALDAARERPGSRA